MCVSGFSQRKIIDFFKIKKPNLTEEKCDSPQGAIFYYSRMYISVCPIKKN